MIAIRHFGNTFYITIEPLPDYRMYIKLCRSSTRRHNVTYFTCYYISGSSVKYENGTFSHYLRTFWTKMFLIQYGIKQ